ncbi:hypothetical protein ACVWWJ_002662 [Luteibacter sp. HA06]
MLEAVRHTKALDVIVVAEVHRVPTEFNKAADAPGVPCQNRVT